MNSLKSDVQPTHHEELIALIFDSPKFRERLQGEIFELMEGNKKTVQLGKGMPLIIDEIYECLGKITAFKVKETLNSTQCSWIEDSLKMKKDIQDIKSQLTQLDRAKYQIPKLEIEPHFKLEQSIITEVSPRFSGDIERMREELYHLKGTIPNIVVTQPIQKAPALTQRFTTEFPERMFESAVVGSPRHRRNKTGSPVYPWNGEVCHSLEPYDHPLSLVMEENLRLKERCDIQESLRYQDRFNLISSAITKIEKEVGRLRRPQEQPSESPTMSKKSSSFASLLKWK